MELTDVSSQIPGIHIAVVSHPAHFQVLDADRVKFLGEFRGQLVQGSCRMCEMRA